MTDASPPDIGQAIHQSHFRSPAHKAVLTLLFTAHALDRHSQQILRPFDLTPEQYNILRILRGRHPDAWGIGDLTERMLNRQSNASRLVDKLQKKRLVDRRHCPTDRRSVEVRVNDRGLELLARIDPAFDRQFDLDGALTPDEFEVLAGALDRIRARLPAEE